MKPICVICGRRTVPAAYIDGGPVGPRCADSLKLRETAKRHPGGRVKLAKYKPVKAGKQPENLDLFDENHHDYT